MGRVYEWDYLENGMPQSWGDDVRLDTSIVNIFKIRTENYNFLDCQVLHKY